MSARRTLTVIVLAALAAVAAACTDDGTSLVVSTAGSPRPGISPTPSPSPAVVAVGGVGVPTGFVPTPRRPDPVPIIPEPTALPTPQRLPVVTLSTPQPVPTPVPSASVSPLPSPALGPAGFHLVAPTDTDPAMSSSLDKHYALAPLVAPAGKLFVFLPGPQHAPSDYSLLLRQAAARGYHALGLVWPNDSDVATACSPDLDCFGAVRGVLFGDGPNASFALAPTDGVTNRVAKALAFLAVQFPTEGWAAFLGAGGPDWTRVAIAGHGLAGDQAAYVASRVAVGRVVLFSTPADTATGTNTSAHWLVATNPTPANRYFGLAHARETDWLDGRIPAAWTALGLDAFGAPLPTEGGTPFTGSHELLTAAAVTDPDNATAVDAATSKDAGDNPRLADAWSYLIGP